MATIEINRAITNENELISLQDQFKQLSSNAQSNSIKLSSPSFAGHLCAVLGALLFDPETETYKATIEADHLTELKDNGFIETINDANFSIHEKDFTDIPEVVPYCCFPTHLKESNDDFQYYLKDYFWSLPLPRISSSLKSGIERSLFDLLENVRMHSGNQEKQYAFVCGKYDEINHLFTMTIANCGSTIRDNVTAYVAMLEQKNQTLSTALQKFHISKVNDAEAEHAIKWAMDQGNSTRALSNIAGTGGFGLALMKDFLNLNPKGNLQLTSDHYTYFLKQREDFSSAIKFSGTIITLLIDMSHDRSFEMKDEEIIPKSEPVEIEW